MAPSGTAVPTSAIAAPAATVLLLRETGAGVLQVLMTRRAEALSFMGGLWVFPGGRMEPADCVPGATARAAGVDLEAVRTRMFDMSGGTLSRDEALGLHVAACRETFEESGVLLAHRSSGADPLDAEQLARLAARREASDTDPAAFVQLLEAEDLLLEVDRLVYWSHWITPSVEKRRFDTRFFAVRVPPGQEASVDRSELTHHAWLGENDVCAQLGSGQMKMAPPTVATLEDLWRSHERHGGIENMLQAEHGRAVPPILPKIVPDGRGGVEAVLPWDRQYASLPGEGCVVWEKYPQPLDALPSRRAFSAR